MRTYLEASAVPTVDVGAAKLPRLVMGIHPYDGCSYRSPEQDAQNLRAFGTAGQVARVLRVAVEEFGLTTAQVDHMIPQLNRLHLQALWETERATDTRLGLVAYILIPVQLDGEMVSYSRRAHATFFAGDEAAGGDAFRARLEGDDILRYTLQGAMTNLVTPDIEAPYTEAEAARFEIDYATLEQYLGFFAGCEILIADPGAEIDLLAMTGRFDLIRQYLAFLRQRFDTVITSVHHAGVTIPLLEAEGIDVDAYMTPVNRPGHYMFPTRELALDALAEAGKPVIAIKPLAGGGDLGAPAFDHVFHTVGVDAALFGMGTADQVRQTTAAALDVLGA